MSTLDVPGVPLGGPSLGSLKTAEEVATVVRLSPKRILELSRAQVLPHFRIDGGEPLFSVPILKAYVRQHLTVECTGAPLPLNLRPIVLSPVVGSVPVALAMVQDRLLEWPEMESPPCIYFLVKGDVVLYVGQSCHLPARLVQHCHAGRKWERTLFLPVPEPDLFRVEGHWIKALKPQWNRGTSRRHPTPSIVQP